MDSLPSEEKERAIRTIALVHHLRHNENKTDEQIATKLEFGSAEAMYQQLENWGFPSWATYKKPPQPEQSKREARGFGDARELRPAGKANELFREVVEELVSSLDHLDERREYLLQGGNLQSNPFVAYNYWRNPNLEEERREYEKLVKEVREASKAGIYRGPVENRATMLGRSWHPPEPLTILIALCLLSGKPLRLLVEALNDDPASVDLEDLEKRVYGKKGLKPRAEQIARIIRGASVKQGRQPPSTTPLEHTAAFWIDLFRRRGLSDAQIQKKLKRYGHDLSLEEIDRIEKLRLNLPK